MFLVNFLEPINLRKLRFSNRLGLVSSIRNIDFIQYQFGNSFDFDLIGIALLRDV